MRKSTVFISAVLTTFTLAILYGVVSAYQGTSTLPETASVAASTATAEPTREPAATVETAAALTPEQAAQLAAQVVGNTDLLSAESSNLNGLNAYKVTFTNNDVVYVGLDGQILAVQIAPVMVNVSAPVAQVQHKNRDDHSNSSSSSSENHDNHENEHEDGHDD